LYEGFEYVSFNICVCAGSARVRHQLVSESSWSLCVVRCTTLIVLPLKDRAIVGSIYAKTVFLPRPIDSVVSVKNEADYGNTEHSSSVI
jgi:hypothetical protein